jgi:hypothetical protein
VEPSNGVQSQDYCQVVAMLPDGREYVERSFASEAAAAAWMRANVALTAGGDRTLRIRVDSPVSPGNLP